jgi:hypothetical protein
MIESRGVFGHVQAYNKEVRAMKLSLSDIETNAVKHALEAYSKELEQSKASSKGSEYELDAVRCVINKMDTVAHSPGM